MDAGHEHAARRRAGQGPRRRHLARGDPPGRRLNDLARSSYRRSSAGRRSADPLARQVSAVRGAPMREGSAAWRRPDASRCRTSRGGFAAVPVPTAEAERARHRVRPARPRPSSAPSTAAERRGDRAGSPADRRADPLGGYSPGAGVPGRRRRLEPCRTTPATGCRAPRPSAHRLRAGAGRRAVARAARRPGAAVAGDVVPSTDGTSVLVAESRPTSRRTSAARPRPTATSDDMHLNDLLDARARPRRLRPAPHVGRPPVDPGQRRAEAARASYPILNAAGDPARMLYAVLTQKQREKFEDEPRARLRLHVPGRARFRVNVFLQRDAVGAVFRIIPFEIMPLEDLGLPPSVAQLRRRCRAASCSSPARPARASRRRSPR